MGGPAATLTIGTPGQGGQATFSGTTGQQVTVHASGNSFFVVRVKILNPDGSTLASTIWSQSTFNVSAPTLPVTGTYTIIVDPDGTSVGSITLSVTNP
jgi:hypothetical protein